MNGYAVIFFGCINEQDHRAYGKIGPKWKHTIARCHKYTDFNINVVDSFGYLIYIVSRTRALHEMIDPSPYF
ncbi:hypothetical protein V6N12_012730 [Hibiscus sabdariffa]|uniref:Uncharacterized protein n=1 Tax=Hibiscus sabdariffa TaxID=183260 RepID=A0ABR2DGE1_9ROSI